MEVSKRCWILIFITTRQTVCVSQLATIIPSSHKNSFQHFLIFLPTPHSLISIMIQMNASCETSHFCKKHFVMSNVLFSLVHYVFMCNMFLWQPLLSVTSPIETWLVALTGVWRMKTDESVLFSQELRIDIKSKQGKAANKQIPCRNWNRTLPIQTLLEKLSKHIFAPNRDYCVHNFQIFFRNTRNLFKVGEYHSDIPQYSVTSRVWTNHLQAKIFDQL